MSSEIRVLLADDHRILRSGLELLLNLEPDIDVVGKAGTGEEAVERVRSLRPDVVVMDLGMPGMDGLVATRQITAMGLETKVVALTSHSEEEYLLRVLDAGGSGFVRKTSVDEDLIAAIRTVARDELFLYPSGSKILLRRFREVVAQKESKPEEGLTSHEVEVLTLTAQGYSSSEAGKRLFLSPKTVDTYRYRLMRKLSLERRADLVRFALEHGFLAAPEVGPGV